MTSLFFLANNSLKTTYGDNGMNNNKFLSKVRSLVADHGLDAKVFSAIACDACHRDEQYGVVVELTYSYPAQLLTAAQVFQLALRQDYILLYVKGDAYPPKFEVSKLATCVLPAGSRLMPSALTLHNKQRAYLKQFGVTTDIVLYEDTNVIKLLSICDLETYPNFDYWQQYLGCFLNAQELEPAFSFARVSRF